MTHQYRRIRQARESKGMSKATLARTIGVHPSAAVQWEQEKGTSPTSLHLAKVAKVLGVAYEWLATGRGSARRLANDEALAVDLTMFAHTLVEERLLGLFRSVSPRTQELLVQLLESMLVPSRRSGRVE